MDKKVKTILMLLAIAAPLIYGLHRVTGPIQDLSGRWTGSRLFYSVTDDTNSVVALETLDDLTDFIAGTASQVTVTDDGDGTATLSGPQDLATTSSPTFASITGTGTIAGATLTEAGSAVWNAGETDIIDSGHYIASSIDYEHLASDVITGAPAVGAFASGDTFLVYEAGVGLREADYDDLPAGGAGDITDVWSVASGDVTQPVIGTGEYLDGGTATTDAASEGILLPRSNDVSAATAEGQISWDADNDNLYVGDGAAVVHINSGTSTAWDDIADPDNSGLVTITLDNAEATLITGDNDAAVAFWTLQNTDADHTGGNMYLLDLDYSADDGDVDADFIRLQDSGSVVMTIQQDGEIATDGGLTAGGTIEGTSITDGTATLNAGSLTAIVGVDASGTVSANLFTPDAADGADIGSAALEFSDIYLADGSIIYGQNDQSNTLTSSATDWTFGLDITVSGGNINTGNIALVVGDATTDTIQLLTDGTGDAEVALPTGSISGTEILDDTVDSDDYAAASIDNEHLADNAVDSAEINTNAVKLDALDVSDVSDDIAGDIAEGELTDSCIVSADIKNDTIDSDDYAAASIDNEHLANNAVDSDELAAGSVDQAHFAVDVIGVDEMEDVDHGDVSWSGGVATVEEITISDDEATDDDHEIVFTTDNANLESDGTFHYSPDTGTVTTTEFVGGGVGLTGLDGENIANDTIDVDSLDWGAFTDLGESGAVTWGNVAAGELGDDSVINEDIDDDGNFVFTGAWDFGGGDLELPQASPAVPGADGGVELDFTDGKLVIQHGAAHAELAGATDVVMGSLIQSRGGTIFEPDGINDVMTVFPVNSIEFPHGIVITAIYLGVSSDTGYVLTVQNFDDFDTINAANGTIDTVTYSADTTGEIIDSTPTYATIGAGQIVMISIPATDVDWISFRIYYYEPAA